jgi:hypothetical protein
MNGIEISLDIMRQGLWLGLLDNRHLDEIGRLHYSRGMPDSPYGDEKYNLSGLQWWEQQAITAYFPAGYSILLAAAGAGREAFALARMGYQVDGFDSTPALTEGYRRLMDREQLGGRVFAASAGGVPTDIDRPYDGLIVGWGGYMHIPGRKNRIGFLTALRRHVPAGAPLLVSFLRRQGGRRYDAAYAIARLVRRLRRSPDPVERGDSLGLTFDHHFAKAEIQAELAESGFDLVEFHEFPMGHAVGRAV